jgi:hypothetical protein
VLTLLLAWAAAQAVLGRAMDGCLWLRDPIFGDKELKLRARVATRTTAAGRPFTVVMLGSSRTGFGLRGDVVEDVLAAKLGRPVVAFNLGMPAAGPITTLISLRRLLDAGERPDVVLIEVLPPLLAGQVPVPVEQNFLHPERMCRDEVELAVSHGFAEDRSWSRWWVAELVPVYGHRFPLLGRLLHTWLPWGLRCDFSRGTDATGWLKPIVDTLTPEMTRQGILHARGDYFDLLQTLTLDGPAARAVGESLMLCQQRGVRAALVLMPEGRDFRSWYPPRVNAELAAFLGGLSRTFGAPLIDARGWLEDECFTDSHHMLPPGASAFSERLGREISPMLAAVN